MDNFQKITSLKKIIILGGGKINKMIDLRTTLTRSIDLKAEMINDDSIIVGFRKSSFKRNWK